MTRTVLCLGTLAILSGGCAAEVVESEADALAFSTCATEAMEAELGPKPQVDGACDVECENGDIYPDVPVGLTTARICDFEGNITTIYMPVTFNVGYCDEQGGVASLRNCGPINPPILL